MISCFVTRGFNSSSPPSDCSLLVIRIGGPRLSPTSLTASSQCMVLQLSPWARSSPCTYPPVPSSKILQSLFSFPTSKLHGCHWQRTFRCYKDFVRNSFAESSAMSTPSFSSSLTLPQTGAWEPTFTTRISYLWPTTARICSNFICQNHTDLHYYVDLRRQRLPSSCCFWWLRCSFVAELFIASLNLALRSTVLRNLMEDCKYSSVRSC